VEDSENAKGAVLRELLLRGKIGGAHAPLGSITNNMPDKFLHNKKGRKAIAIAIKELANACWVIILQKRTGKGSDLHISINPRKIKEINDYLIFQK